MYVNSNRFDGKQCRITCQVHAGYSINVPLSVHVQEGLCVTIPCKFTANYSNTFKNSFGYWMPLPNTNPSNSVATNDKSRPGKRTNFNLTGNPDSGDCSLTITDARKEDTWIYYFRFEESKTSKGNYGFSNVNTRTMITVTDLTEEPVISDPGTVIAGISKTLTCTPPRNCSATSLVVQWRKSNVAGVWKNSSTVTFTPSLYDHQQNLTCQMTNSNGKTTQRTILLHVCHNPEPTAAQKSGDIAIGFVCGIGITILILLLYKLTTRKKWTKKVTYMTSEEPSASTEPPIQDIYMNVNKPKEKDEEATNNIRQLDSRVVTMDKNDLNYSTVAFTAKSSKVPSSHPEAEYAEIKVK
ncbi:myeloid cell surface antigen CD33-like [Eleutherodactylus coqui]|uniref:myeloid cell surface antigen CD33-like n=1 Tax=Eleutherodactylus coqui TaxID=57060 RepID=UPI0034617F49